MKNKFDFLKINLNTIDLDKKFSRNFNDFYLLEKRPVFFSDESITFSQGELAKVGSPKIIKLMAKTEKVKNIFFILFPRTQTIHDIQLFIRGQAR